MIDNPGSGEALRFQDLKSRIESEGWAKAQVDYLEGRSDVDSDKVGLVGWSLGGYYVPRAAAFEKRIKFIAVWGANHNWGEVQKKRLLREGENLAIGDEGRGELQMTGLVGVGVVAELAEVVAVLRELGELLAHDVAVQPVLLRELRRGAHDVREVALLRGADGDHQRAEVAASRGVQFLPFSLRPLRWRTTLCSRYFFASFVEAHTTYEKSPCCVVLTVITNVPK